ncbi:gamma-glutamyltransferase [Gilvimarinus agarilyticus]|uniref:gamma-glutamyltransferase n=1 Tax=unclassified Gilvimarinus TaxID=2642066 RepID=UPI001C09EA8F|nr:MULTISPECIES: gamma-glutamyltransferase [unclassified Gilvimarinus]MBU2886824.1 gamma-glutamyltransferase [Gilvimarinus agarilyticus]MDO6571488.1 gamma-glutamyltransferase [Gilvimarinus sp. 2_MG-2023]MDO6747331.1 gamma-glutamyltransferase [Gilvimarinus sp. 1_MG-2023]
MRKLIVIFCLWVNAPMAIAEMAGYAQVTEDGQAAVATVQPRATEAAMAVLNRGGNAVDAAVAAALALGVVDGHNSGIGGGSFAIVRWADGTVEALDGREQAPAKAHRDMFVQNGQVQRSLSRTGALASGIPGSVALFDYMLAKGGALTPEQVYAPAITLAEEGFAIDQIYADRLARHQEVLTQFPASAEVLLDGEGNPWPVGHKLLQEDLAKTYKHLAKQGAAYFYQGAFAQAVEKWMIANDGLIRAKDFANYQMLVRQPVHSQYRGYEVFGFGPPSSGGVHVAQILNILQSFELSELSEVQRYHVIAEAMKLAFADRAYWLGDPAFTDVPKGLVRSDYAKALAGKVSLKKTLAEVEHGTPAKATIDLFDKHTTHIATADKQGNWVAITTTVNTDFGSKVIIPGTGVVMNNQMDDFSAQPGVPNIYGLVGTEANAIAPGKRPLSSMSPTLLMKNNKPVMTLGAAGGPTIISQVVQAIINHVDLGLGLYDAIALPRVHHQWRPQKLYLEPDAGDALHQGLQSLGHSLKALGPYGSTQAIEFKDGHFIAVSEPRLEERNRH